MNPLIRRVLQAPLTWVLLGTIVVSVSMIALAGHNPLSVGSKLLRDGLMTPYGLADVLVKLCPILLAALAVVLPLRAGLYNIGGEGQMYIGGLCAATCALLLPDVPRGFHFLLCAACGAAGGALWATLPALLKTCRGTSEVISTLLLNYLAANLVNYLVSGPLMEPGAPYPYSPILPESAQLPPLFHGFNVHLGVIFSIALALGVAWLFAYTPMGLAWRIIGENPRAAAYAGISVSKNIVSVMAAGGALAGLAGALEILAVKHRLFHLFVGGYGYDGIVAALVAGGQPVAVIASSVFVATLKVSGNLMQRGGGVPVTVAWAIEGLVVVIAICVLSVKTAGGARPLTVRPVEETHPGP